jgi:uncharacterized membrane protein YqjE
MTGQQSGLMASLRRLTANFTVVAGTRLELLANEVEEEKLRLGRLFLLGSLAMLFFGLAVMLATVFVVVLFWDSHRLLVVGGLAGLFVLLAVLTARALRTEAQAGSKLFSASLAELAKDRHQLTRGL